MTDFEPRKWPKQARSKASFAAILEAAAQLLRDGDHEALTTNHIAARAGVSIGTLYEFFGSKEAIIAVLAAERMKRLHEAMIKGMGEAALLGPWRGVSHMLDVAVSSVAADREVLQKLLRQISFVPHLPAVVAAQADMMALAEQVRIGAGDAIDLPQPEVDTWLISQMLYNAILEIAFLDADEKRRAELTKELARLTYRMAVGRDPEETPDR